MRITTLVKKLSTLTDPNPWQKLHIYVLARNPRTGLYERTYLDLKHRPDGRPYFIQSKNQTKIREQDRLHELRQARRERRHGR